MPTRQAAASAEHLHSLLPRHRSHQALSAALSARRTAGSLLGPVAVALLGLWGPPALAQFSSSGAVNVYPGNALVPNGAGNVDLGNVGLFIGNGALGSFSALGGSMLRVGSLSIGPSCTGNGNGVAVIDGTGTLASLIGDGFSSGVINRLGVGE